MKVELSATELKALIESLYIDIESGASEKKDLYNKLLAIYQTIN